MTSSTSRASAAPASTPQRTVAPARIAATVLILIQAAVTLGATIVFGLVQPEPPLIGWSIVAFVGFAIVFAALPGLVRGRRWAWTTALCWVCALLYWGLYKVLVEGETEGLVATAGDAVILVLLLVPAGRPS